MMCFGIIIMWCEIATVAPTDSLCTVYQPVIQSRGDSSIKAPLAVKQRILANEMTYRRQCRK